MSKENGVEYIFITHDGKKHYEIVMAPSDMWAFKKLHNARTAMPLKHWEKMQRKAVKEESPT